MTKNAKESFASTIAKANKREAKRLILEATPEQLAALDARPARRPTGWARVREEQRKIAKQRSLEGRDIGAIPDVLKPRRRNRAAKSFEYFCRAYFAGVFTLKWSEDHLRVLAKTERAILDGGLFSVAMPRGSGKTSIAETAALWAILYGHRQFIALIGPSEEAAAEMMQSLKAELEQNDDLLADFPEVCFPVRALEGISNRTSGQLCQGRRTRILWTANQIVMPTIEGSAASGTTCKTCGITGRIRGLKFKTTSGESVRPDLVIVDDPSTDASARSASDNAKRENILAGAVLGLAGPGKKISGLVACTVIQRGDLADRILDPKIHPEFNGERCALVYKWPKNTALWDKYAELRAESFRTGGHGKAATSFYRKNRKAMDAGSRVAWPQRKHRDELSAIQHAYNLRIRDERAFFAEYQNDPLASETDQADLPTASELAAKVNGYDRRVAPLDAEKLVAFIDIQQNLLYWSTVAWSPSFTGYVVDYGTWPDQTARYFTLGQAKRTLGRAAPGRGLEASIFNGLEKCVAKLAARTVKRDDGAELRLSRVLIDANWGLSTETVYSFCRQSPHAGLVLPSHGRGVGASSIPFSEYKKKAGDLVGLNWRVPAIRGKRTVRHAIYDTNFWKSFLFSRFATGLGDPGALTLYKSGGDHHRLLADHLSAEYRVTVSGRGRAVDEWKLKPSKFDNHWFDCLVGCAVAGSIEGATLATIGADRTPPPKRRPRGRRVSYLQ